MVDTCTIWLPNADLTHSAGVSLANCLYGDCPLVITLSGELGAGKTTFLQGFMAGLGVTDHVASPTYALEQRYNTNIGEVSHIDLYRLDKQHAKQFLEELDEDYRIRCIEWPERVGLKGDIHITLAEDESNAGRHLEITFRDIPLPEKQDILVWRDEVNLPENICAHCDAVADFAGVLTEDLLSRGIVVRPEAVKRAALVHDLLRFVDFKEGAGPKGAKTSDPVWEPLQKEFAGMRHEHACEQFLRQRNYHALADIVAVHGLQIPCPDRSTTEQKLLYYADKRVKQDEVVSLKERFADFRERYSNGEETDAGSTWESEATTIETELFPLGPIG